MCVLNSLLAQCCFLRKLFNFNIFHLHGPFMRKNCLYFFIVKTRNLLASTYYLKFMKLCYWISNESNNRPLKYENNKHFYAYEKWYEFRRCSLWIFFSPNLLRFVSMRAWHGLFFSYSFSSLCNSSAWKVKCKHEIIRKVHSWCIRKSIVQFFSLFFRFHCCNQLFNEYNNEHSYHLWMKHTLGYMELIIKLKTLTSCGSS